MKEERKRILEMLAEGKINAEEAARLLDALGDTGEAPRPTSKGRYVLIHVEDPNEEKKINIKLPVGLLRAAGRFIPAGTRATINGMDLNLEELLSTIDEESEGEILRVEGEDGETVIIRVERGG
ncbi:MAG: SHOCT-like domain-containing protein [candidate division WOR-3 bacterium]